MKAILIAALSLVTFFAQAQNVGIGISTPGSKLEVSNNSTVRPTLGITDSSTLGMGTVRFRNAGKSRRLDLQAWNYTDFAKETYLDVVSDSLTVATFRGDGSVGIGVLTPSDKLHVNGNMNITGTIKLNGNVGTPGQVLTSNGTADPAWQTLSAASSFNMRLMLPVARTNIPFELERNLRFGTPVYNNSGGQITTTDSVITFNETGLYELEAKIHFLPGGVSLTSPEVLPVGTLRIYSQNGGINTYYPQIRQSIRHQNSSTYFSEVVPFRFVVHVTAGTIFSMPVNIFGYLGNTCCDGVEVYEGYISIVKLD